MSPFHVIRSAEATDDHRLILRFENDEVRVFDVTPLLTRGRFRELVALDAFRKVRISYDTVEWENGLDLDPEYLYECSQSFDKKTERRKTPAQVLDSLPERA